MIRILAVLLAVAAGAAAAAPEPPAIDRLPARAVDHVARMEGRSRPGAAAIDHVQILARSDPWIRIESHVANDLYMIRYADVVAGASFAHYPHPYGRLPILTVDREPPADAGSRLRRERTDRRGVWLGEACEVWSITGLRYSGESCETEDGVVMWERRLTEGRRGHNSAHAVRVERRSVRPEEARPPADFFSRVPAFRPVPATDPRAFEVRFVYGRDDDLVEELYRRSGGVFVHRAVTRDGAVSHWGTDGVINFTYEIDAAGRPYRLHIAPVSEDAHAVRPDEAWVSVPDRDPETRFGERCTWQQRWHAYAVNDPYQCRTEDGIPLILETRPEGGEPVVYRAASLRRGDLQPADFAMPPAATQWATWGVEPIGLVSD